MADAVADAAVTAAVAAAVEEELIRPYIHVLNFADSGAGKSSLAATFPKPMVVFMWDPPGKDIPYWSRGIPGKRVQNEDDTWIQPILHRRTKDLLVQIEYYSEPDPEHPTAYLRFLKRMSRLSKEYDDWETFVLDSVTFFELAARKYDQYKVNKAAKDKRQHYAASSEAVEEIIMMRFPSLPKNVVVTAHVDEKKDDVHGYMIFNPAAPGNKSKKLPAAFQEIYHSKIKKTEKEREFVVQTRSDNIFNCATQIDAPDECEPHYSNLWENWDARMKEAAEV